MFCIGQLLSLDAGNRKPGVSWEMLHAVVSPEAMGWQKCGVPTAQSGVSMCWLETPLLGYRFLSVSDIILVEWGEENLSSSSPIPVMEMHLAFAMQWFFFFLMFFFHNISTVVTHSSFLNAVWFLGLGVFCSSVLKGGAWGKRQEGIYSYLFILLLFLSNA